MNLFYKTPFWTLGRMNQFLPKMGFVNWFVGFALAYGCPENASSKLVQIRPSHCFRFNGEFWVICATIISGVSFDDWLLWQNVAFCFFFIVGCYGLWVLLCIHVSFTCLKSRQQKIVSTHSFSERQGFGIISFNFTNHVHAHSILSTCVLFWPPNCFVTIYIWHRQWNCELWWSQSIGHPIDIIRLSF